MKQLTFYKYSTIALIILNLLIVTFFLFMSPKPGHRGKGSEPGMRPHNILNLDENQKSSFLELVKEHQETIRSIDQQQRQLLTSYFRPLYENGESMNRDSLLNQFQNFEAKKVESTYQHFEEVKAIIRPEQEKKYEEFVRKTLKVILKNPGNEPPPPRD